MALLIKNQKNIAQGKPLVSQVVHISRAAATVPQTAAQNIFQVNGGRVEVIALVGEVTTVIGSTTENIKVTSTRKDASGATVGTAVDVATNVDCNALEVGGSIYVGGDGGAAVKSNAGVAALGGTKIGYWICPQGIISYTTGASTTGAIKWDIWFQPLDEGATVVAL